METQFVQQAREIVEAHLSDSEFRVAILAHKMGLSRQHLNRKLRTLTGSTAREFIRTIRLEQAVELLNKKSYNIAQIAYDVGFQNPAYFARCFREKYGKSPREHRAGFLKKSS